MSWSAARTWVTSEIITAAIMNSAVRDNLRYLKGQDGTAQIEDGLDLIGTGTASWLRPPRLTTTQRDALSGTLQGRQVYNVTKDTPEAYGTGWEELPSIYGTSVQGDVVIRTSTGWDRLPGTVDNLILKTRAGTGNPLWDTPSEFSGTLLVATLGPASYTILFLSGIVGTRRRMVNIRAYNASATGAYFQFRPYGETLNQANVTGPSSPNIAAGQMSYVMVAIDASARVEWLTNPSDGSSTLWLESFW